VGGTGQSRSEATYHSQPSEASTRHPLGNRNPSSAVVSASLSLAKALTGPTPLGATYVTTPSSNHIPAMDPLPVTEKATSSRGGSRARGWGRLSPGVAPESREGGGHGAAFQSPSLLPLLPIQLSGTSFRNVNGSNSAVRDSDGATSAAFTTPAGHSTATARSNDGSMLGGASRRTPAARGLLNLRVLGEDPQIISIAAHSTSLRDIAKDPF
jgi:hypothetical protein